MDKDDFTGTVIGYAMKVHGALGPGFVEYVYRNALLYELRKAGMKVEVEKIAKVHYEGVIVGEFRLFSSTTGWSAN